MTNRCLRANWRTAMVHEARDPANVRCMAHYGLKPEVRSLPKSADSVAEIGDLSREGSRPYERPARSLVAAVPVRPMPPSIGKRKRREEALSEAPQVLGDGCEHELVLRPAWTA